MLQKSQIFSFLFTFTITFVVGFFVWGIINPDNNVLSKVLGEVYQISSKVFPASLDQGVTENIIPVPDFEEEPAIQEPLEENLVIYENIITEQQRQDLLDDMQEKLDIMQRQVQELIVEKNIEEQPPDKTSQSEDLDGPAIIPDEQDLGGEKITETLSCVGQININTASLVDLEKLISVGPIIAQKIIEARPFYSVSDLLKVSGIGEITLQKITQQGCAFVETGLGGGGGGGGGDDEPIVYPKIIISEVQISPISQRFVELYNPSDADVSLTDWYLQRKTETATSWGSFVSSTNFEGKIIPAGGYFLISREFSNSDILLDITLSDNNSLALKNPGHEISDEVTFGKIDSGKSFCGDWGVCAPTPEAQNVKWEEPPAPTDTTPPEVLFNLDAVQSSLDFLVSFTITDISTTTTPSGLGSYIFRWQGEGSDWQTDDSVNVDGSPVSVDFTRSFAGQDGKTYNFQIQATDLANNISDWLPIIPATTIISVPIVLKPILISEVQISPISQRFVELYNPNSTDIDLTGWYLQRKTETATSWGSFVSSTNFEGKIITANGYFLISRELADSDILFNITLSDNNSLALKNPSREIVDKVGWGSASDLEGISAQSPAEGKSITRTLGIDTNDNSIDFIILDTPTPKG